jgi:hypothetical protein
MAQTTIYASIAMSSSRDSPNRQSGTAGKTVSQGRYQHPDMTIRDLFQD